MTTELGDPRTDLLAVGLIERLCQEAGCAVNRAFDDQNGWDLIVEFPAPTHLGPPDTRPPALKCFVQVKSTQGEKSSVAIKLSNGLKLARNPLPCFTALVLYADDGKTATKIYLQHFDKPQIEQTLKAGRQAHADGETALNQKHITQRFMPEEETPADDVVSRMSRTVPMPATYAAGKDAFANEVGYEEGYATGKLSFAYEHVDAFIDAMLGKDVSVPIENMSVREQRFGIVDPKAKFDGSGKIQIIPKPFKTCRVTVRHPDTGDQIVLPGEIFVPGIPNLPEKHRRIRVRTDILEFTCSVGEGRNVVFGDFTASFGAEERASIDRLDQLATLWSWFESGPLEMELWVDSKRFLHGQIETKADMEQGYWRALRLVTSTLAKFVDKDLRPSNLEFSLTDFARLKPLIEFSEVVRGASVTMRFDIDGKFPDDPRSYVMPIFLELGAVVFFAVARYRVKNAVITDGSATVELVEPSIQRRAILLGSLADNADFAREETRAVEGSCAKDGEEMVFGFLPEALTPGDGNPT